MAKWLLAQLGLFRAIPVDVKLLWNYASRRVWGMTKCLSLSLNAFETDWGKMKCSVRTNETGQWWIAENILLFEKSNCETWLWKRNLKAPNSKHLSY